MEIALHYPYIIPSLDWMKQSLLLSDRISSIVPPGYRPGDDFPPGTAHRDLEPHLRWLENEGHWVGVQPVRSIWRRELGNVIDHLLEGDIRKDLDTPSYSERLDYKLRYSFVPRKAGDRAVLRALVESGLAEFRHTDHGGRLWVSRRTLYAVTSMIA